jgi:hypothetical protein
MVSVIKCNIFWDDNSAKMPASYRLILVCITRCILTAVRHHILNEYVKAIIFPRIHIGLLLKYISSGAEITLTQLVCKIGQLGPPIIFMWCRPTVASIRKMGRNDESHVSINPIEFMYYRDECMKSVGSEMPKEWVTLWMWVQEWKYVTKIIIGRLFKVAQPRWFIRYKQILQSINIISKKNKGYMFRLKLLGIISPNYKDTKGNIFYKFILG